MGVTDSGAWLQTFAIAESSAAACVIPAAWPLVAMMGLGYSDPGQMEKASAEWSEVAKHIDEMKTEMSNLAHGVPPDKWSAKDNAAFQKAVAKYNDELQNASQFAGSVGTIMQVMAYGYFAWSLLVFAAAQILAIQALAIVASSWFPPAAAALEAAANATAGIFDSLMSVASVSLTTAVKVAGGVVAAGMAVYFASKSWQPGGAGGSAVAFKQATLNLSGPTPTMPTA
jgi:hypothetical protein